MTKNEILRHLESNHDMFTKYIDRLTELEFNAAPPQKWTSGQQLEHIVLSVKPLAQVFLLPRFVVSMMFGKANRPSKTYDELVEKYKLKLSKGGAASGAFVPKTVTFSEKTKLIKKLNKHIEAISRHISAYSEDDLDRMILPHPLLGKITIREMLYFTAHHVVHHQELVKGYLTKKQ